MISKKQWFPLIGMTIAAFIFNTSEFMPIGLLSDIASTFHLTSAHAGLMITVYSWAVMLLSLPLMLVVCNMSSRNILLLTLLLFSVGQVLSAFSIHFTMLIIARLFVACAHAIFWSVASVFAVKLVHEEKKEFAMSLIITGSSIAMIFGLPLGRMIGLILGWRTTFACVGIVSILLFAYQYLCFPKLEQSERFQMEQLPRILKNKKCISIYILSALFASAYYTGYSYIEPFLKDILHLSSTHITEILSLFGLAGIVGSFLFSKLYTKHRASFLNLTTCGLALVLLFLKFASIQLPILIVLCLLWGMISTAFNVACQAETIRATKAEEASIAMSIFSGIFNLGIGLGSFIGGQVILQNDLANIGLAGGSIAIIGALFCVIKATKILEA